MAGAEHYGDHLPPGPQRHYVREGRLMDPSGLQNPPDDRQLPLPPRLEESPATHNRGIAEPAAVASVVLGRSAHAAEQTSSGVDGVVCPAEGMDAPLQGEANPASVVGRRTETLQPLAREVLAQRRLDDLRIYSSDVWNFIRFRHGIEHHPLLMRHWVQSHWDVQATPEEIEHITTLLAQEMSQDSGYEVLRPASISDGEVSQALRDEQDLREEMDVAMTGYPRSPEQSTPHLPVSLPSPQHEAPGEVRGPDRNSGGYGSDGVFYFGTIPEAVRIQDGGFVVWGEDGKFFICYPPSPVQFPRSPTLYADSHGSSFELPEPNPGEIFDSQLHGPEPESPIPDTQAADHPLPDVDFMCKRDIVAILDEAVNLSWQIERPADLSPQQLRTRKRMRDELMASLTWRAQPVSEAVAPAAGDDDDPSSDVPSPPITTDVVDPSNTTERDEQSDTPVVQDEHSRCVSFDFPLDLADLSYLLVSRGFQGAWKPAPSDMHYWRSKEIGENGKAKYVIQFCRMRVWCQGTGARAMDAYLRRLAAIPEPDLLRALRAPADDDSVDDNDIHYQHNAPSNFRLA